MAYDFNTAIKDGNTFEDNVFIDSGAIIGKNNHFSRNCTIRSNCKIGNNNYFMSNVTLGSLSREWFQGIHRPKQLSKNPMIEIGDDNIFEDNVIVQTSLETVTKIANNTYIGAFTQISHDVEIGNNTVLSSHCSIGGYTIIMESANLGMGVRVHQRSVIGSLAMVGAGSVIVEHITPFATVVGVPAHYVHINRVGLVRAGIVSEDITRIEEAFKTCSLLDVPETYRETIIIFKNNIEVWKRRKGCIPNIV